MDVTVENGYKCGLCPRRLASKYSLERHIRLKHKSDLEGAKKQEEMSAERRKLEFIENTVSVREQHKEGLIREQEIKKMKTN